MSFGCHENENNSYTIDHFDEQLRDVFDLCDQDNSGYILVEHFESLAYDHFGTDQSLEIADIISVLDQSGEGRIYYRDFCRGIEKILDISAPSVRLSVSSQSFESSSQTTSCESSVPETCSISADDMLTDDEVRGITSSADKRALAPDSEQLYEDEGNVTLNTTCDSPSGYQLIGIKRHRGSISSNALASQLYRRTDSPPSQSTCSEDVIHDLDGNFSDLNGKVKHLEEVIGSLTENQNLGDQHLARYKQENSQLVNKINQLEDKLRDLEAHTDEKLKLERRSHRDTLSRTDRDAQAQIELLNGSLSHLQREYAELKEQSPKLRLELEGATRENQRLERELTDVHTQYCSVSLQNEQLTERLVEMRENMEQERKVHAQLLDELSREVEELRVSRAAAVSQEELQRLHDENVHVTKQRDELQMQLTNSQVQVGRELLQTNPASLAAELNDMPRQDLVEELFRQQSINKKMRDYVDSILVKIMEKSPALLEVAAK